MEKPKLIVFDLDYTLWPFWVDTHVKPPFSKRSGKIVDSHGYVVTCYDEVPEVLEQLYSSGYKLAVASRTGEIKGAKELLKVFDWNKYFTYKQIYPGGKTNHFEQFKKQSSLPYSSMLFFDDEQRNISDLKSIGVTSILVKNGINKKVIEDGLKIYKLEHQ